MSEQLNLFETPETPAQTEKMWQSLELQCRQKIIKVLAQMAVTHLLEKTKAKKDVEKGEQ